MHIHDYLSKSAGQIHARESLHWDVTQPPPSAKLIRDGIEIPFESFSQEPATIPRLSQFKIISHLTPWAWNVKARNPGAGITVGDFLTVLSWALSAFLSDSDIEDLSEDDRRALWRTLEERCPDKKEAPRVVDMLFGQTTFGGFVYDKEYEKERKFIDNSRKLHLLVRYLRSSQ